MTMILTLVVPPFLDRRRRYFPTITLSQSASGSISALFRSVFVNEYHTCRKQIGSSISELFESCFDCVRRIRPVAE